MSPFRVCDCGGCFRCVNPEWEPAQRHERPEPDPDAARDRERDEREDGEQ